MKNKKGILILVGVIVVLVAIVFVTSIIFNKYKQREKKNSESIAARYYIGEDSISDKYIFNLNIVPSLPNVGFPTGLKQYPILTWQEKTISSEKNLEHIDVKYPEFIGGSTVKKLNGHIYLLIEAIISQDRQESAQTIKDNPDAYPFEKSVSLDARYNVIGVDNGIVSVELVTTDFTGGGNGNHDEPYPINWDLKSDRLLSPSDIFCSKNWISTLMPMARKVLLQYYNQTPNVIQPIDSDTIRWINDGTSADNGDSSNWQNFLLSKGGLIVAFPPYQIFSGVFGITRIYIPDSATPHFLCLP